MNKLICLWRNHGSEKSDETENQNSARPQKERGQMEGETMKTAIIIILCIALILVSLELYQTNKRLKFWQRNAIGNGRGRIKRNESVQAEIGQIHAKTAKKLTEQAAIIEDLQTELRNLRKINENYKKQLERSKS